MDVKKVSITPEEIFVLGKNMNAKYIDYAYVAAVKDIGVSYDLFEKEVTDGLVAKGLLEEDFSGTKVVNEETSALFKPIFFGQFEATLDICTVVEPTKIETLKFHYLDDQITKIIGTENALEAELIEKDDVKSKVEAIVSSDSSSSDTDDNPSFAKESVSRYIVAKSVLIGKQSIVSIYMESNGRIFKALTDEEMICLKIEDFKDELYKILTGVM